MARDGLLEQSEDDVERPPVWLIREQERMRGEQPEHRIIRLVVSGQLQNCRRKRVASLPIGGKNGFGGDADSHTIRIIANPGHARVHHVDGRQ